MRRLLLRLAVRARRSGRRFRQRVSAGRLLLEMASIILAVLLALGAKEWREQRQHRTLARTALENVADEAQSNRAALRWRIEKHEALQEKLGRIQQAIQAERPFTDEVRSGANMGLRPLRNAAFRSAQAMQALPHIEPALVARLAQIERSVQTVETFDNQIRAQFGRIGYYEILRGRPYEHPHAAVDPFFAINSLVDELVENERGLRRRYEALLGDLRGRGLDAAAPGESATPSTR